MIHLITVLAVLDLLFKGIVEVSRPQDFNDQRKLMTALAPGGGIHEQNFRLTNKAKSWSERILGVYQGGKVIEPGLRVT